MSLLWGADVTGWLGVGVGAVVLVAVVVGSADNGSNQPNGSDTNDQPAGYIGSPKQAHSGAPLHACDQAGCTNPSGWSSQEQSSAYVRLPQEYGTSQGINQLRIGSDPIPA